MDTLNTISVSETAIRELHATGARLVVHISGLGVHKLSYSVGGLDTDLQIRQRAFGRSRSTVELKAGIADLSSGLSFSHPTQVFITVKADFIVAAFANGK